MEKRRLGRTGLDVSLLTFGCGAVGGLMTKGEALDQDRAVAWARDNGINHFDTAPLYGNGASETNLGRALGKKRDDVIVSTKIRLTSSDRENIETVIRSSLDQSLKRLRQERVDLLQLHNMILPSPSGDRLSVSGVLRDVIPVFEALRQEGKIGFLGFTANGDTEALHDLVLSGAFDTAQIFYNVLTPSAGEVVAKGYPGQNYNRLLHAAADKNMGSIGVRVLAGGAMSGRETRHPLGMPLVAPIGSGKDYAADAARARRLQPVIDVGHAESLPELAIRYVISNRTLSTTEVGIATLDELEQAASAINKGPLSKEALTKINEIRKGFIGEA